MPTFEVREDERKPRKLRQRYSEKTLERLLEAHPSLLGHVYGSKTRKIVWFWHYLHGPGDLWGFDDRGYLVIVEIKKALGGPAEKKAASQLRKACRKGRRFDLDEVDDKYKKWKKPGQAENFSDEFRAQTGRTLHAKFTDPYLYIVAGHYTRRGWKRVAKHPYACVMVLATPVGRGRTIVSTERIK